MDDLITGLIEIIDEQQALIVELIEEGPETEYTSEVKEALKRIAAKTENLKRNVDLILAASV